MNSYERLFARMEGKPVDRVPNNCIIMGFGAKLVGATYKEFATDYKVLTKAAIRCHEEFDIDILSVISDPMREAEGFGAEIVFQDDGQPFSPKPLVEDIADLSKVKLFDPESSRRTYDRLLAVQSLAEYSKKKCAVQGWVEGAFAEACDLHNINNMMMDIIEEPEAVKELLEICTEEAIAFSLAQIKAGADIIGIGDAAASLIGPNFYEEFALPYEIRIIDAIHKAGGKAKLHICGNINPLLEMAVTTGADMIDIDWMVDFKRANDVFGNSSSACGNFDPVAVLLKGTSEEVEEAVRRCLSESSARSIIAAGCEVPMDTPIENLRAVAKALKKGM
jgi:MtaA/CmuA family methyltransferase